MFEPSDRDDLSSCGGLDELPKWLLFESLMEIAGERGRGQQGMRSVDRDRLRQATFSALGRQ
jgi:hypothetical protein